jgi:septum formation protein
MRVVLASASPRRAELLRAAGFAFDVVVANIDESIRAGESPSGYVRRLAAEKSAAVHRIVSGHGPADTSTGGHGPPEGGDYVHHGPPEGGHYVHHGPPEGGHYVHHGPPEGGHYVQTNYVQTDALIILGADTTVVVDGEILGKPRDAADAAAMVRRLSGRRHEVLTGVSVRRGAFEVGRVEATGVYFAALSEDDIAWYVASGDGQDKAGAYAIQGLAARFIPRIDGSYSNVVGLPISCVHELMTQVTSSREFAERHEAPGAR